MRAGDGISAVCAACLTPAGNGSRLCSVAGFSLPAYSRISASHKRLEGGSFPNEFFTIEPKLNVGVNQSYNLLV